MKHIAINYNSLLDLNIGDYIQSLAARQYLNESKLDFCERDDLNNYNGEQAKLIYNCWFTAKPDNFPPSDDILPLFRSFHLNSGIAEQVLSKPSNVSYFKKFEPIGCRDINSARVFEEYGIKAYFSGCLTTTLGYKYKHLGTRENIYVVDLISTYPAACGVKGKLLEVVSILNFSLSNFLSIVEVYNNLMKNNPLTNNSFRAIFRRWLYCSRTYKICKSIFPKDELQKVTYITHLHDADDIVSTDERFSRAKTLITKYSKAKLVLSSRIHCILPCLGLNTPSIYFDQVNDHPLSSCRKEGLIDLFNVISLDKTDIVSNPFGKLDANSSIINPDKFEQFANSLKKDATEFIFTSIES